MAWTEIQNTDEVKQGDRLRFTYRTIGLTWITAAQEAIIQARLAKKGFNITSIETTDKQIIVECTFEPSQSDEPQYQQASIVSGAIIIAAATAVAGLVLWLLLDKIEKWEATTGQAISDTIKDTTSTPAGKAIMTGGGVFLAGLGIALVYWLLKKK
jgi:hypothetical protein